MANVRKRDGRLVPFDTNKPFTAILGAFNNVDGCISEEARQCADSITKSIASYIEDKSEITVEEIQDCIERKLMQSKYKNVAKAFILYRDERTRRRGNTTDSTILGIIDGTDDYWMNENSNKNAFIAGTQRDYLAGCTSTDLARRKLLPEDIMKAHDNGIIHFHDIDYFVQHIHNCCLVNLEDMLQNGTVINKVKIDKPHSFQTACTLASQIAGVIASGQYGGQTMSMAHLAPFVQISREKITAELAEDIQSCANTWEYFNDDAFKEAVERRVRKEIEKGIQTLMYQINTINSTNGQTPFISLALNINEAEEGQTRDDLALIISEIFKQRIQGFKNEKGIWVTPAFPKLLYFLDDNNTYEGSEYYWLTVEAAKCTAKRMVPDYISAKKMRELKNGDVFPCMGCRSFLNYDRTGKHKYYGRLTFC